jgi:hypothetical protein
MRVCFHKTPMIIAAAIARVERGFAVFANVPYHNPRMREELGGLFDES